MERETFLDALDQLPRVFGHLDAFPRNLVVRQSGSSNQLIAIDWASVGFGAVGEELAPLIASSLIFFEADVSIAYEWMKQWRGSAIPPTTGSDDEPHY